MLCENACKIRVTESLKQEEQMCYRHKFCIAQVTNTTTTDFFDTSVNITFSNGMSNANGSLSTVNDEIPELQETFIIEIVSAIGAAIGSPSTMVVVIEASDDPYGSVEFIQVCTYNSLHSGKFHLTCRYQ